MVFRKPRVKGGREGEGGWRGRTLGTGLAVDDPSTTRLASINVPPGVDTAPSMLPAARVAGEAGCAMQRVTVRMDCCSPVQVGAGEETEAAVPIGAGRCSEAVVVVGVMAAVVVAATADGARHVSIRLASSAFRTSLAGGGGGWARRIASGKAVMRKAGRWVWNEWEGRREVDSYSASGAGRAPPHAPIRGVWSRPPWGRVGPLGITRVYDHESSQNR